MRKVLSRSSDDRTFICVVQHFLVFVGRSSVKFELIFAMKYIFSLARIIFTHIIHYFSLYFKILKRLNSYEKIKRIQ